tara:strand:- start:282 stop:494 length:213 start_codon:yes stop_codon:yes gene_type:complete
MNVNTIIEAGISFGFLGVSVYFFGLYFKKIKTLNNQSKHYLTPIGRVGVLFLATGFLFFGVLILIWFLNK